MKSYWNYFLLILLFASCTSKTSAPKLTHYIAKDAQVILTLKNPENLKTNLNNATLLNTIVGPSKLTTLNEKLSLLDSLHIEGESYLAFKDSTSYALTTKLLRDSIHLDSLTIKSLKHTKLLDDILIIGSNEAMLQSTLNDLENKISIPTAEELAFTLKNNAAISKLFFINDTLKTLPIASSLELDADISQNSFLLNGIASNKDSLSYLSTIFKNTIPQEQQISRVTPSNSDGFLSFTFDDITTLTSNLKPFSINDSIPETSLFDFISEIGVIYEGANRAIAMRTIDEASTIEALQNEKNLADTYRDIPIYTFSENGLFANTFYPLITTTEAHYYCTIDTFVIFANTIELLQTIISSFQNNTTLEDRNHFESLKETMFDEASLTMVTASNILKKHGDSINTHTSIAIEGINHAVLQLASEIDFSHINIHTKKSKAVAYENSITEQFSITLGNEILTAPQFVKNHKTRQREIVVQDVNNRLYLISNTGKILWKKQLHGAILGTIEQIDMYQNGRLQLAFATANRLYVLDRNGNNVDPFPIKFNETITQPLAVFDYDRKRDYRLLVTQGKYVHMYDQRGTKKRGFKFKQASGTILAAPKHIRIGSKDYITFKTENKLHILTRKGLPRVTPKNNYTYSNQNIFLNNNNFITTSASGDLVSIKPNGTTTSSALNLDEDHSVASTSKTLVTLSNNNLSIRDKVIELDFGEYTAPEIFYKNDKLYIALTDLQTQKVYVYDSQAKLLPNFPVYGNSSIDLNNIDKDRALEFVTKSGSNGVIVYEMN